jgi:hypothetical protein
MLVEIAASRCPPESGLPLKAVVASTSTTPSRKGSRVPIRPLFVFLGPVCGLDRSAARATGAALPLTFNRSVRQSCSCSLASSQVVEAEAFAYVRLAPAPDDHRACRVVPDERA